MRLEREHATYCRFNGGINEPIEIISPFLWTRLVIKISLEFPQVLRLHDSLNRREPQNKLREPGGFLTLSSLRAANKISGGRREMFLLLLLVKGRDTCVTRLTFSSLHAQQMQKTELKLGVAVCRPPLKQQAGCIQLNPDSGPQTNTHPHTSIFVRTFVDVAHYSALYHDSNPPN